MKPAARREPAIKAIDAPPSFDGWPDGRVTCGTCGHRSRDRCIALKTWAHLPNLKHWCDHYARERTR